jgi:hypothetical protein
MSSTLRKYGAEWRLGQLATSKPSDATTSATYDHEPSKSEIRSSAGSNHVKGRTNSPPYGRDPSVSRKNASLERSDSLTRTESLCPTFGTSSISVSCTHR